MARMINGKQAALSVTTSEDGLWIEFANGRTLSVNVVDLGRAIYQQAALHGLKQKLVDAAAMSRNPETGREASVEDKYLAVFAVYERLLAGQWNAPRGEGGGASGGLLFRALCAIYPDKTPDALREFLGKKTDKEKAALRKNPRVAAAIEELRSKDAPNGGDDLLAELED